MKGEVFPKQVVKDTIVVALALETAELELEGGWLTATINVGSVAAAFVNALENFVS